MIEAQNVSFSYAKKDILKGVSLKLDNGKLYALIGPNGCGKTTLINLFARLSSPKDGEIFLNGTNYDSIDRKTFAQKVALLPQGRNIPNMSVYDFVSCGRFPYLDFTRKLNEKDKEIINSALEETDTKIFADKLLKKLSGGERQRVYIAMLLAQNTDHILLDEPTTHLDISAKFDIMNLLSKIKNDGKCVVTVLHDIEFALKYADEIILMSNGEIISKASAEETVNSDLFKSVIGVECQSFTIDGKTVYNFISE